MKIKNAAGQWTDINRNNYDEHVGNTVIKLGEGIGCVKTDDESAHEILKTAITGTDGIYTYYYFLMNLGMNRNKTTYIINESAYTVLLKGEFAITIDDSIQEGLPVFDMADLEGSRDNELSGGSLRADMDYNLIASEYFNVYSFSKYNNDYFYFDPDTMRWQVLKGYDDYNILISKKNRNYIQRDKRQIMDSMQIYLHDLKTVRVDRNKLLFKNNKVLDIMTRKVSDFDGSEFILNSLNANWYDNAHDIPVPNLYMTKVLQDLTGLNVYKTEVEDRRYRDLLIYIGYMLTDMQKQNGLMMFGKSQNGKSTLAALVTHIKGSGFKPAINPLINDVHYLSGFYNERILFFDELKPVDVTDKFISIFNQLLGDDEQSIREMNKAPRKVSTNFTAMITVNEISDRFVNYRALLRRVKIMNSTFPVITNLDPSINLNDELRKQDNVDWLANIAIRRFIDNDYRIDNLFVADMAKWIYELNHVAKSYLDVLIKEGYIDEDLQFIKDDSIFKMEQSQVNDLNKQLGYRGDIAVFDEQINIVFQFVLGTNDMSCVNGGITWR